MIGQNEKVKPIFDKAKRTEQAMNNYRNAILFAKIQKSQLQAGRNLEAKLLGVEL